MDFFKSILSWIIIDIFYNKHIITFENDIHRYMYNYLEINNI